MPWSLWPMIDSGANFGQWFGRGSLLGDTGKRFPSFQRGTMGRYTPFPLLALKINMSFCDAWTCGSHFVAMRRAHVGAKPSAEGNRAERQGIKEHKTLLELWTVSYPEISPTWVIYNIQPSHCFSHCQSGLWYLQPKSFLTDIYAMADFSRLVFSSFPPRAVNTHLHSLGFLICLQPQPPPKSLLRGSCDFLLPSPGCPFSPSQPPFQTSLNISLQICFLAGPRPRGQLSIVGPSPGLVPPKSVSLMARPPGLLSIPWLAPSSPSLSLTQSHCLLLHSCPSLPWAPSLPPATPQTHSSKSPNLTMALSCSDPFHGSLVPSRKKPSSQDGHLRTLTMCPHPMIILHYLPHV